MYGFKDKDKAVALSGFAGELLRSPTHDGSKANVKLGAPALSNDFRSRCYIVLVEVVETIGAATWDYTSGPIGRWIAGRGKVRVYQKFHEPDPEALPQDRLNRIGVWNHVTQARESGGAFTYRERIRECFNHKCLSYPSTQSQVPKLYLAWEDVHGTLWIEPKDSDPKEQHPYPVEATDCILPGQGSSTVKRYIYDGSNWVDSGETCVVNDPTCLLMALPGEIFWVTPNPQSGEDDPCYPSGSPGLCSGNVTAPHGLRRRVRIKSQVGCDEFTAAEIMEPDPDATTGNCSDTVLESPAVVCTIQVCNKSGRKLMCSAVQGDGLQYEDGIATLDPATCTWYFEAYPRAMRARVILDYVLCHNTEDAIIQANPEFLDVCNWAGRETITKVFNPLKRQACKGKYADVEYNAVLCRWEVKTVEPHIDDLISDLEACTDGSCGSLDQKRFASASIETCNCEPTSSPALPLITYNAVGPIFLAQGGTPGQPDETCEIWANIQPLCIIDCNAGSPYPVKLLDMEKIEYLKGINEGSEAIECTPGSAMVLSCGETAGSPTTCIPLEDCPEPNDPIEKP